MGSKLFLIYVNNLLTWKGEVTGYDTIKGIMYSPARGIVKVNKQVNITVYDNKALLWLLLVIYYKLDLVATASNNN